MSKPDLLFSMDVSGQPCANMSIGCVSFNFRYKDVLIADFRKKFGGYVKKKGRYTRPSELRKIIGFLDDNGTRMVSIKFNANNWRHALSLIPKNKGYRNEKICGILYYMALQPYSKPKHSYPVIACNESFMNIKTVISSCRTIAKMRGIQFEFSTASDKYNIYVKLADFIASAAKKLKEKEIRSFNFFRIIDNRISPQYIKKVFS